MNEVVTYIPPFTRSMTRSQSGSQYGLPTWVEQSKDTCAWSTSSFPIIIYSGSIISFLSLSFIFFFPLPTYTDIVIFIYTVHAGCLYVTDTLSTPTFTEPPSVECQDLLIPCQIECMCSQNRSRFIVPSERLCIE